jgi:iron complex transport system ATP-binding protein
MTPIPGQLAVICGPNGAGKTTLLKRMAGLAPGGTPRPRQIAYLPQGARAEWGLRVEEVVALGRLPHHDRDPAAIAAAITATGIAPLLGRRIDQLSGGEQRRVMLARVLATNATILLLDEPTNDLDPPAAHVIMLLLQTQARAGSAVVLVLHAIDLALRYADRLLVMQNSAIIADGAPLAVLPAAAQAFGMDHGIDPHPRLLAPP